MPGTRKPRKGGNRKRRKGHMGGRSGNGSTSTAFKNGIDQGSFTLARGVPKRKLQRLCYVVNKVTAASVPNSSVRFTPNAAYDVDPTLGSAAMAYFVEWSSFYGFVRVKGFGWDISLVSLETAKPCRAQCVKSNADPGTTMTSAWGGYAYTQTAELGINSGPSKCTFKGYKSVADILGSDTVYSADSYRSTNNTLPADLVWLGIGVETIDGSNFANGVSITGNIFVDIEWYDRLYNGLTYQEKIKELAIHYSTFIAKRQKFKALQDQKFCPCTPPHMVEEEYKQKQLEIYKSAHPGYHVGTPGVA
jgi:hypothetical protein